MSILSIISSQIAAKMLRHINKRPIAGTRPPSFRLSSLQLTNKTISSSQTELENRLHQLTETLIQKQTMLEALGTEKSSLVFQLERLEQQLKNAQGGQSGGQAINIGSLEVPGKLDLFQVHTFFR